MIPEITPRNILNLIDCFETYREGGYTHQKDTCAKLDQFNEEEMWLLAFVQYLVFWNRTWSTLDATSYYLVPTAPAQRASFEDFLNLLRHYGSRKLSPKNEKELIVFLSGCTERYREFYLDILSRQDWLRGFYTMRRVRDYIDRSLVHPEDIYGELQRYRARFGKLPFPIMVTTIPKALPSGMIVKGAETRVYVFRDAQMVKLKNWLRQDLRFIGSEKFTLLGLIDEEAGEFYPTDYFPEDDYRKFCRGINVAPYYQRLAALDHWLTRNFLRQIKSVPKAYVVSPAEIDDTVRRVLAGSEHSALVFTKENQRRFISEALEVKGIIEGVWSEQGVAKGLAVWHNARLLKCSYAFEGSGNALLFRPEVLQARVVRFWLFRFDDHRAGAVKEILWDERPFMYFMTLEDGSKIRVEKCAFCARDITQVRLKYGGICYNTMCNLQQLFGKHGPDTWFRPTASIERWREAAGWEPYLLNSVAFTYKGYRVVSRESDGWVMFQSDPEVMARYRQLIDGDSKWSKWVRKNRLKFTTGADLRERYLKLQEGKRGQGVKGQREAGATGVQGAAAGKGVDLHGVEGGGGGGGSAGDQPAGEGLRGGGEELPLHQPDRLPEAGQGAGSAQG